MLVRDHHFPPQREGGDKEEDDDEDEDGAEASKQQQQQQQQPQQRRRRRIILSPSIIANQTQAPPETGRNSGIPEFGNRFRDQIHQIKSIGLLKESRKREKERG